MAKRRPSSIRWRDQDKKELARTVKNFNAKITRLAKQNPKIIPSLPEKVSVKDLKNIINNRQDFNRIVNSLQRFTQKPKGKSRAEDLVDIPGNENNVKITRWQRNEMNRAVAGINRRRENRLEKVLNTKLVRKGKYLGYEMKDIGMGKNEIRQLTRFNSFTPSQTHKDVHKKFRTILKEGSESFFKQADERLKQNFMKAIEQNFPQSEMIKEILDAIESTDTDKFVEKWRQSGSNFENIYMPSDEEIEGYARELMETYVGGGSQEKYKDDYGIYSATYDSDDSKNKY